VRRGVNDDGDSKVPLADDGSDSEDSFGTRDIDRFLPLSHCSYCRCFCVCFLHTVAAPIDSHHDRRRHSDNERGRGKTVRRLRRLEKTVEALSHGLILALTQLKSESGGQSGDVPHAEPYRTARPSSNACDEGEETVPGDTVDTLSTALAGMGLSGNSTEQLFAALVTSGRLIMIMNVCSAPRSWYATTVAA